MFRHSGLAAFLLLWSPPTAGFGPAARVVRPRPHAQRDAISGVRVDGVLMNAVDGGSAFEGRIAEFAPRTELPRVRSQLTKLQQSLDDAVASEDFVIAAMLRDDIAELRSKDPAAMATSLREELERHVARERYAEAARCRDELMVLRRFLPQYQLAGLWKGNYPKHGDELVRLHYKGDQLFATKVTGDEHVPAGEVTFRANLEAPFSPGEVRPVGGADDTSGVRVEVLSISSDGGHEQREVEQFGGEGRVAARGFRQAHYVPGQLFLMDDDVVGFLWVPIGTFVVFSRVPEEEEPSTKATTTEIRQLTSVLEIDVTDADVDLD